MITYNISDLFRENTNNCKNGEEAHNETIRSYGLPQIRLGNYVYNSSGT